MDCKELNAALTKQASHEVALHSQRFFKTAEGEYGHGDQFLGIRVPVLRQHVRHARSLALGDIKKFLHSKWHEKRLFALLVLVDRYQSGDETTQQQIFDCYLANTPWINNWDLVDSSAYKIVGPWLADKDRSVLFSLAVSQSLWERRIAVMSTFHFIREDDLGDTFALSELLLQDKEELIHKAVGWMLREAGKRDRAAETRFLKTHYAVLPRTLLRYAIEKYRPAERKAWLAGDLELIQ